MAYPLHHLLAQDMNTWWNKIPGGQRFALFTIGFTAAVIIPLSINAAQNPTSTASQAYNPSSRPLIENGGLTPPNLPSQTLTCTHNLPCSTTVRGLDADAHDNLTLNLDFLPEDLHISQCQTTLTLTNRTRVTCTLEGIPVTSGTFLLLGTLTDDAGNQATQTITLNVR